MFGRNNQPFPIGREAKIANLPFRVKQTRLLARGHIQREHKSDLGPGDAWQRWMNRNLGTLLGRLKASWMLGIIEPPHPDSFESALEETARQASRNPVLVG